MWIAPVAAKRIAGTKSNNFNPIHRVRMLEHWCFQGAVIVRVSVVMGGLGHVQAGPDVAMEVDAHLDKNYDEHDDNSKTNTHSEVQPGFLLMFCKIIIEE